MNKCFNPKKKPIDNKKFWRWRPFPKKPAWTLGTITQLLLACLLLIEPSSSQPAQCSQDHDWNIDWGSLPTVLYYGDPATTWTIGAIQEDGKTSGTWAQQCNVGNNYEIFSDDAQLTFASGNTINKNGDDATLTLNAWDLATSPTGSVTIQVYLLSEQQNAGEWYVDYHPLVFTFICKYDSFDTGFGGQSLTYTVGDPYVDIDLGAWDFTNQCNTIVWSWVYVAVGASDDPIDHEVHTIETDRYVRIYTTSPLTPITGDRDYTLQVTATSIEENPDNGATMTKTFSDINLTIVNPCASATFVGPDPDPNAEVGPITVSALGPSVAFSVPEFQTQANGGTPSPTLCGTRSYSYAVTSGSGSFNHVVGGTNDQTLTVSSTNANDDATCVASAAPYACEIAVTVTLDDYPAVTATYQIGVVVTKCLVTSFSMTSGALADQIYNIDYDADLTTSFPTYTQTPACGYTLSFSADHDGTSLPVNGHSLDSGNSQLVLSSTDRINDPGVYTVSITMFLADSTNCDASLSPCGDTQSFQLTMQDACTITTLDAGTATDMATKELDPTVVQQTIGGFTNTIATAKGDPAYCGPLTWAFTSNAGTIGNWLSNTDNAVDLLSTTNTDSDDGSPYTVTCTATLAQWTSVTGTVDFTVTIGQCEISTLTVDAGTEMADQTYSITDPTLSVNYPTVTQDPACGYTPSYSATQDGGATSSYITVGASSIDIQTDTIADENTSGTTIAVTISYPGNPVQPKEISTADTDFVLTITNPCRSSTINDDGVYSNLVYAVLAPATTSSITENTDSVSKNFDSANPTTLCGPRTYTYAGDWDTAWGTDSNGGVDLSIYTGDISYIGTYTIDVTVGLSLYPEVTSLSLPGKFTVTINPCEVTSFTASGTMSDMVFEVLVDTAPVQQTIPSYTQDPACGYSYTLSATVDGGALNTPPFTLDTATPDFEVYTTDLAHHGTYAIVIQATAADPTSYTDSSVTFNVDIKDGCYVATIDPIVFNPTSITSTVLGPDGVVTWPAPADSFSTTYSDGFTLCGDRAYSLALSPVPGTGFTTADTFANGGIKDDGRVTQAATLNSQIGTYTCTVTTTLASYATNPGRTDSYTCKVDPCVVLGYSADTPIADDSYGVGMGDYFIAFPTYTTTPNCVYTATFDTGLGASTYGNLPSWATSDQTGFTINTSTPADGGTYTLSYKATLDDAASTMVEYTFQLQIVDPCLVTDMIAPADSNVVQTVAGTLITINLSTDDTASTQCTDPNPPCSSGAGQGLCGTRSYYWNLDGNNVPQGLTNTFIAGTDASQPKISYDVYTEDDNYAISGGSWAQVTYTEQLTICLDSVSDTSFNSYSDAPTNTVPTALHNKYCKTIPVTIKIGPCQLTGFTNGNGALSDTGPNFSATSGIIGANTYSDSAVYVLKIGETFSPAPLYFPGDGTNPPTCSYACANIRMVCTDSGGTEHDPCNAGFDIAAGATVGTPAVYSSWSSTVFLQDTSLAGAYTVWARCTLDDTLAADGTTKAASEVDSTTDTFTWNDPCLSATMNNHEVAGVGSPDQIDLATQIEDPDMTTTDFTNFYYEATDDKSVLYANNLSPVDPYQGLQLCGPRQSVVVKDDNGTTDANCNYLINIDADSPSGWVDEGTSPNMKKRKKFSLRALTTANGDQTYIGAHSCRIETSLVNYPTIVLTRQYFEIVVTECVVTAINLNTAFTGPTTHAYGVFNANLILPLNPTTDYTQVPDCGYTVTAYPKWTTVHTCADPLTCTRQTNWGNFPTQVTGSSDGWTDVDVYTEDLTYTSNPKGPEFYLFYEVYTESPAGVQFWNTEKYDIVRLTNPCDATTMLQPLEVTYTDATGVTSTIDLAANPGDALNGRTFTTTVKNPNAIVWHHQAYEDSYSVSRDPQLSGGNNIPLIEEGHTTCGERSYAISSPTLSLTAGSAVEYNNAAYSTDTHGQEIRISPQLDTDIGCSGDPTYCTRTVDATAGCHSVTLSVSLVDYPLVSALVETFTICIEPCLITGFGFPAASNIADTTFNIYVDSALTLNFPTYTQVPACGYANTFSYTITDQATSSPPADASFCVADDPSLVAPTAFIVDAQDAGGVHGERLSKTGVYRVILTNTLDDTFYGNTVNSNVDFILTMVNPCLTTVINDGTVTDQVASPVNMLTSVKLGTPEVFQFYRVQDSISSTYDDRGLAATDTNKGASICGQRVYTLTNTDDSLDYTSYNFLTAGTDIASTGAGKIEVITDEFANEKFNPGYNFVLNVCLASYPAVTCEDINIEIEIKECQITSFVIGYMDPADLTSNIQPDLSHVIFGANTEQLVTRYVQTPDCGWSEQYSGTSTMITPTAGAPVDQTNSDLTTTFVSLDTDNYCGSDTCTFTCSTTAPFDCTMDTSQPKWIVDSDNFAEAGTYTVTQTVTLLDFNYGAAVSTTVSNSYTLTISDPCLLTVLQKNADSKLELDPTVPASTVGPAIVTSVLFGSTAGNPIGTPVEFEFPDSTDSMSELYCLPDSLGTGCDYLEDPTKPMVCRERTYTVSYNYWPGITYDAITGLPSNTVHTDGQDQDAGVTRGLLAGPYTGVNGKPVLDALTIYPTDVGLWQIKLEIDLSSNYPNDSDPDDGILDGVTPIVEYLWIEIQKCRVLDVTIPAASITWAQTEPVLEFEIFRGQYMPQELIIPTYTMSPACGYDVELIQERTVLTDNAGVAQQLPGFSSLVDLTPNDGIDDPVPKAVLLESYNPAHDLCTYDLGVQDPLMPLDITYGREFCTPTKTEAYDITVVAVLLDVNENSETPPKSIDELAYQASVDPSYKITAEFDTNRGYYILKQRQFGFYVAAIDPCHYAFMWSDPYLNDVGLRTFVGLKKPPTVLETSYPYWTGAGNDPSDNEADTPIQAYAKKVGRKIDTKIDGGGVTYLPDPVPPACNPTTGGYTSGCFDKSICGSREYLITTWAGSLDIYGAERSHTVMPATVEPPTVFQETKLSTYAGLHSMVFHSRMVDYPNIHIGKQFTSEIFWLKVGLHVTEKYYQCNTSPATQITFTKFEVTPDSSEAWKIDYSMYIYDPITGVNMEPDPNLWTFNALTREIKSFTLDCSLAGEYIVRIRARIDHEDFLNAYTDDDVQWFVTTEPPPIQPTTPPTFKTPLNNQAFDWGYSFEYQLPETFDLESDSVEFLVNLMPSFLKFDQEKGLFYCSNTDTKEIDKGDYTISVTLKDSTGAVSEPFTFVLTVGGISTAVIEKEDDNGLLFDLDDIDDLGLSRPVPTLVSISEQGLVTIIWDQEMRIPKNLTQVEYGSVDNVQIGFDLYTKPNIEIIIERGEYSIEEDLSFHSHWNFTSFERQQMTIQLWFTTPSDISYNDDPEKFYLYFYGEEYFTEMNYGLTVNGGGEPERGDVVLFMDLPPQILPDGLKLEPSGGGSSAVTLITFIANLMLSASLNQLWSLINTQQIIVMIPLFDLNVPENAASFFNYIMTIAAFDIIPTDDFYSWMLSAEPPPGLTENFEVVGFETIFFIHNLGSLGIFVMMIPFLAVVNLFFKVFKKSRAMQKVSIKIETYLYWNASLRIVLEAYTIMAVCGFIQTTDMEWNKGYGPATTAVTGVFFLVICLVIPFFMVIFLRRNFAKLPTHNFERKYGALYEGLRLPEEDADPKKLDKSPLWYNFWFLFRRLTLAYVVVYSRDALFFQLAALVIQTVVALIIVGNIEPLEDRFANKLEYFNEVSIMGVMYCAICFTDWLDDPEGDATEILGYIAIAVVGLHIGFNLFLMFKETVGGCQLKYRRWKLWRQYAKVRGEKLLRQEQRMRAKRWKEKTKKYRGKKEMRTRLKELQEIQEVEASNESDRRFESYRPQMQEASLSDLSLSDAEAPEQTLAVQKQYDQTEALSKQPLEAPKVVRTRIKEMDHALHCRDEQTRKLGLTRAVDQKLTMEKDVHKSLGQTIPVDTIIGDVRKEFHDEGLQIKKSDVLERLINVQKDSALPTKLDPTITLHNQLVRQADQDVGRIKKPKYQKKKEKIQAGKTEYKRFHPDALHLAPDTNVIHGRLFLPHKAGDGGKQANVFQEQSHQKFEEEKRKAQIRAAKKAGVKLPDEKSQPPQHDPNSDIPVPSTPTIKNPQSDTEFRNSSSANQHEVIAEAEEFEYDYEYDSEEGGDPPLQQANALNQTSAAGKAFDSQVPARTGYSAN